MNLKDRMKSDIPNQASSEPEAVQEISETEKNQKIQIQQLLSEKSELTSVIADLRAELSSVQRINLSLTKRNDDLRNSAGLLSRKEQKNLEEKLATTQALLAEANKMINMSNVEAVRSAQAAKEAAEQKAVKDIAYHKKIADNKVSEAIKTKNDAVIHANEKVKTAEKNRQIAQGSLFITLLCCIIMHPIILSDAWDMVYVPAEWVLESMGDVESALLALVCIPVAGFVSYRLWLYYRKRWCCLSQRILLASLAAVILFGDIIHKIADINLVLLVIIIQILYLGLLIYLDDYFETHNRTYAWIRLQKT